MHGAFSLASREGAVAEYGGNALLAAGFWNYLREDITFSLFQGCPLKMDLASVRTPTFVDGQSHLHSISLILGRIINLAFSRQMTELSWQKLHGEAINWREGLPPHLLPFSTIAATGESFPRVRFLQDYHGTVYLGLSQYSLANTK